MPPDWLLWLLPLPVVTSGAIAWASWSGRARGPQDTASSVRAHQRFRDALAAARDGVDPEPPSR